MILFLYDFYKLFHAPAHNVKIDAKSFHKKYWCLQFRESNCETFLWHIKSTSDWLTDSRPRTWSYHPFTFDPENMKPWDDMIWSKDLAAPDKTRKRFLLDSAHFFSRNHAHWHEICTHVPAVTESNFLALCSRFKPRTWLIRCIGFSCKFSQIMVDLNVVLQNELTNKC